LPAARSAAMFDELNALAASGAATSLSALLPALNQQPQAVFIKGREQSACIRRFLM